MEVRTVEYIEKPTKTLTDGVYLKEGDSHWRILDIWDNFQFVEKVEFTPFSQTSWRACLKPFVLQDSRRVELVQ